MATNRKSVTSTSHDVPQLFGGTAIKPIERHGWEKVRYFIYNPETGAIFSRTPKSWFLIFLFYVIFYSCLAGFWYGMLQIFFLSLNDDSPKWTQRQSIIGVNPGMGVRPRQSDARIDSSMFLLRGNWNGEPTSDLEQDTDAGFAARMKEYVNRTYGIGQSEAKACTKEELEKPRLENEDPCLFNVSEFGECSKFPYGYSIDPALKPCVIVKLNKIFGFIPEPLTKTDDLEGVPENIKKMIEDESQPHRVYIDCQGENPADVEALQGKLRYFPEHQGIPMGHFPHQKKTNLASPAIAVQFDNVIQGQLLHIECKVWFKGVIHDRKERMGLVHFEVMVESDKRRS